MPALTLTTEHDVGLITFDRPGEAVNTLSSPVKDEFLAILDRIDRDDAIRAVVLLSGKPDTFIAGADIEEFLAWTGPDDARRASAGGQAMLARIEDGDKPVVAAIHGACLGGGLELALACAWRVATDHPRTVLALPEVQLGLVPGMGGTQRLPRAVGLRSALDMILTGRNVRARKAAQLGLVHELVHPAILRSVAVQRARELAAGTLRRNPSARPRSAGRLLLEDNPIGRALVLRRARAAALEKTRGNYPAPLAALDAVAAGSAGEAHGFAEEARCFGEMAASSVSRELIFLFFAGAALRKDPGVPGDPPAPAATVDKLGVLGAGFMGAGIAAVAVQHGVMVRLKDADLGRVGKGVAAMREVLGERLAKRQVTRQEFDDQMLLAGPTVDYSGFADVDCVIEAVFEDLRVKQAVLREAEAVIPPTAVFASNTSTIPITAIAEAAQHPERVLGTHFFSPVHKMPLLEVIVTSRTAPTAVATAVALGKRLGKTVIVVNDAPGFYVNRILAPYINEAGRLLDLGADIAAVDRAMTAFGFPVGPVTLLDEVGLDIASKSGAIFHEAFGDRMAPSGALRRVVESGRLGRKNRSGFYMYDAGGRKGDVDPTVYGLLSAGGARTEFAVADIQRRCALAMVNEAVRCLAEGIVRSPRDADVGAVFGIGFPPFRGGPLRYVDAVGAAQVVADLEALNDSYPGRFEPADLLLDMARRRARFHPATGKPA